MKSHRTILLALSAALSMNVGSALAQDDAAVRKELEAQYLKLADGRVGDAKIMEQYSKQFLETNEPPYNTRFTIRTLTVSENSLIAVAEIFQEASRYRELAGKKRVDPTKPYNPEG